MLALFIMNLSVFFMIRNDEMVLGMKESIISVNFIWILLGIGGAIPMVLYSSLDFSSAFFISSFYSKRGALSKAASSLGR